MEDKEEEKKITTIRDQVRVSNSSSSSFPIDLISQILLKLNAKSLARSRCVSKLWSSITTDRYFISSFANRPSGILLLFRHNNFTHKDKLFVFTFPQPHQNLMNQSYSCEPLDSYKMECPKSFRYSFTESVHGLLCYIKRPTAIVWNPTMRRFLTLPKPEKSWKGVRVVLGYDPIEDKHKVMCMPCNRYCDECRVWTLGSSATTESWISVKTNHNHLPSFADNCNKYRRCINGVVYYTATIDDEKNEVIMSFDVRSLKFQPISIPCPMFDMMIAYEGKLCLVQTTKGDGSNSKKRNNGDGIKLWILEDAKKQEWSVKCFIAPFKYHDKSFAIRFTLSGVTDGGEFIYVASTILNSVYILYFHPERNSFTKVEFKGIADDKFRRINGLGGSRLECLRSFPNHMENLSSL